jgi:hypothetical protein
MGGAMNYSVDSLKRAAFVDELNNKLLIMNPLPEIQVVISYLQQRIKEIDKKYENYT